jgi:predicted ATPase/class 3 adenylate cyclase
MPVPPVGTVTLLFTDIEGSTALLHRLGERYGEVLEQHRHLLRAAFEAHNGYEFNTQGDALSIAFAAASDAVASAVAAQRALSTHDWPEGTEVRVRIGIHTGEPSLSGNDYVGLDVHRAARLANAGHGGQVLVTQRTRDIVKGALPDGVTLHDLGEHLLRDLLVEEPIFQLVIDGLCADFPPLRSRSSRVSNLPAQSTSFVGREQDVIKAATLLKQSDVRLLTLTGPGGGGKTRLALQIAEQATADFLDGAHFVSLAALTDAALVLSSIASALGLKETLGRSLEDTLHEHLREKDMLLLLDNFEQIVSAAQLIVVLLAKCPNLKVLVTSRVALHVRGEHEYPVPPLALPGRRPPPPLELLTQFAAVALFIERAQAVKPDFDVTKENAPFIAEICHRLDGLPLAIELAAARVKLLPPQAMLGRLENRLKLLTGGSRDLPLRQQTLRATVAWSYDLLNECEKALFRRLAVFAGGSTFEAMENICDAHGVGDEEGNEPPLPCFNLDVFDVVSSLMDNSLLWQQETGDEPRFFMLETLRAFGQEKLTETGEEHALRRHHAKFYLALAEAVYPQLLGSPDQAACVERLEREQDNLRAALSWLVQNRPSDGLRMAVALARFWRVVRHDVELRESLERALEQSHDAPILTRIVALREMGEVVLRLAVRDRTAPASYRRAVELLEGSAALSREVGDLKQLAWTLRKLGEAAQFTACDLNQARTYYEESLAIERTRDDKPGLAAALQYTGSLARDLGDLATARARYEESAALWRAVQHESGFAACLTHLAALAYMQRDHGLARSYTQKSLPVFRRLKDRFSLTWALRWLGELSFDYGDFQAARAFQEEYLAVSQEMEDTEGMVLSLWGLGKIAFQEKHYEQARPLLGRAMIAARDLGNKTYVCNLLVDLAGVAAAQQSWERAARLLGATQIFDQVGDTLLWGPRRDALARITAQAREALGDVAFDANRERSPAMKLEQIVEYALSEETTA